MSRLWIFGCSFSSGHLTVPRESSYGNLLGKEMNIEVFNLANPGRSNDKLFYELLQNIQNFKEKDIIIFQFSSFDRKGFFIDNELSSYFSTAGLLQLGIEHKRKEIPFCNFSKHELNILTEFLLQWHPKTWKFEIENIYTLLEYLKNTLKIRYTILYMLDDYFIKNDYILKLPIGSNLENISMHEFVKENKLTLTDEFPDRHPVYDSHPGINGHIQIKNLLKKHLYSI
jgi:hypothetical protein